MIELFSVIFTSVLGGGATGLLGVIMQRYFDHKKHQQDIELVRVQLEGARETRKLELEAQERMASVEADAAVAQARIDLMVRTAEAQEASLRASYEIEGRLLTPASAVEKHPRIAAVLAVVDVVRGLMRPGITAYSLGLLTAVFLWVRSMYVQMGLKLSPDQIMALTNQCVGTVVYLATTCVVWWFGVRPPQPPQSKAPI